MSVNIVKKMLSVFIVILAAMLITIGVYAAPYNGKEFKLAQPDNTQVSVKVFGDEFYQRVESPDGYTLVRDTNTGWICYANLNSDGSDFESTGIHYTGNNYNTAAAAAENFKPKKGLKLKKEAITRKAEKNKQLLNESTASASVQPSANPNTTSSISPVATTENITGLTILINFPDVTSSISRTDIVNFFNQQGYTGYSNNGSIKDYYSDVSGGKVQYTNNITEFYTAQHNFDYYDDPNVSYGTRARELLAEALDHLRSTNFDFSTLSTDSNNRVRAINIFYAGSPRNGWSKGLWPHKSSASYPYNLTAGGMTVYSYQITNIGSSLSIGTTLHENGHMLFGWPDTYDYGYDSEGTGNFDLMGYYGSSNNPVPPNPYFRSVLSGWGTLKNLTNYLDDTVVPIAANSVDPFIAYNTSNNNEFFMVENIQETGRRASMPGSGLLVWHIDRNGNNNNQQMTSSSHFMVSIEQADGLFHLENNSNYGDANDFFYSGNKDNFNDTTAPNTKWWSGTSSNLSLYSISAAGNQMTFKKTLPGSVQPTVTKNCSAATSNTNFIVFANNVPTDQGITRVLFPTWTDNNGQDDLIWHEGQYAGNGRWQFTVKQSDHNNEIGLYIIHVYVVDAAGNYKIIGNTTVNIVPVNSVAGINIALNKTATASISPVPTETPDKAVNGTVTGGLSDKWCTGYNNGANSWLMVDLGKNYYFNWWKVVHEKGAPYGDQRMFTKGFKLQKSPDGINWTDVDTVTDNTDGITERNIASTYARYVRLFITDPDFDTAARIYEFQLFNNNVSGINNIALNKTATASISPISTETPDKAVNGTVTGGLSDKWCTGYNNGANSWLMVDLGNTYNISRWKVVYDKGIPNGDQRMYAKSFKFQVSADGINWTDADSVTNNTDGIIERYISSASARYVRLYIVEPDFDTAARVYEFQVFQ